MIRHRFPISCLPLCIFVFFATSCGGADNATSYAFPTVPLLDPNTANVEQLRGIAGVTEEMAEAIVAGRPYSTQTEMHAVIGPGLNEADQRSIYGLLFIKVGLNSGAEEDYKLIPSSLSANKLAHEFEEYRPYKSLEQFRREMSKYVSDEEVDHLARYVTLD